jgi:hypothetical protein
VTDKAGLTDTARVTVAVKAPEGPDVDTQDDGDTDGDGLPDDWEMHHFGDLSQGAFDDSDGDGISNLREYEAGTDPNEEKAAAEPRSSGSGMLFAGVMIAVILLLVLIGSVVVVALVVVKRSRKAAPARKEEVLEPQKEAMPADTPSQEILGYHQYYIPPQQGEGKL